MNTRLYIPAVLLLLAFSSVPSRAGDESGDGIMAVWENGRVVYVNAPKERPARKASTPQQRRSSVLVYWSNKEKRWRPVPSPSPATMSAARNAAAEVATYVESTPAAPGRRNTNPNYRNLARGHAVTTGAIEQAIERAAAKHNVDPNLVRAVIKVESNFNPNAVSRVGAMGLMQLMPATARSLNVTNPFDPHQNVEAGVRHLKTLLNNFGGDLRLSLAAYNAGERRVAQRMSVPNFRETKNYVKQITELYWTGGMALPAGGLSRSPGASSAPVRVYRDSNGVLTMTNLD